MGHLAARERAGWLVEKVPLGGVCQGWGVEGVEVYAGWLGWSFDEGQVLAGSSDGRKATCSVWVIITSRPPPEA